MVLKQQQQQNQILNSQNSQNPTITIPPTTPQPLKTPPTSPQTTSKTAQILGLSQEELEKQERDVRVREAARKRHELMMKEKVRLEQEHAEWLKKQKEEEQKKKEDEERKALEARQERIKQEEAERKKLEEQERIRIPREEWLSHILRKYPKVVELRERTRFLRKEESFSRLVDYSKTDSSTFISKELIMQFVLQHLDSKKLNKSLRSLEKESEQRYNLKKGKSQLAFLLKLGLIDFRQLWELSLVSSNTPGGEVDTHGDPRVLSVHNYPGLGAEDTEVFGRDCNIWDEPPDNPENIKIKPSTKTIIGGTLNKLIERLTPEQGFDASFITAFLTTYQSFTTPSILISKLSQRYKVPRPRDLLEEEFVKKQKAIQLRVCNVLKMWIEKHFYDFNERVKHELNNFIDTEIQSAMLAQQLRNALQKKEKEEDSILTEQAPEPIVPKTIFSPSLKLLDVSEEEIARQYTLRTFEVYHKIRPREFLLDAYRNERFHHRAVNVRKMLSNYDKITFWSKKVILDTEKYRDRGKVLTKLIRLADHLRKMNNFSDLDAILSGLSSMAIERLKYTWAEVPRGTLKILKELRNLMSPENNYQNYRNKMNTIVDACIPCLMVSLGDLAQIERQHQNFITVTEENSIKLINFEKCYSLYQIISGILRFQDKIPNFTPLVQVIQFIKVFEEPQPDRMLVQISYQREADGAKKSDIT